MVFYAYIMYVERYSLQWKTNGSNVLIYNKKPIRVKRFLYYFKYPLSQSFHPTEYTKSRGVSFGRLTVVPGPVSPSHCTDGPRPYTPLSCILPIQYSIISLLTPRNTILQLTPTEKAVATRWSMGRTVELLTFGTHFCCN